MNDIETMRSLREAFKAKEDVFGIKRWATEAEAELLYTLVRKNDIERVVELGTANGWTAAWFALAGAKVLTFDLVSRPKMYADPLFPFPELQKNIRFVMQPSPECLSGVRAIQDPTLYFIDALHTYDAVRDDHTAVLKIAKPGDLIVHHDAYGCTPCHGPERYNTVPYTGDPLTCIDCGRLQPPVDPNDEGGGSYKFWRKLSNACPDRTTIHYSRNGIGVYRV